MVEAGDYVIVGAKGDLVPNFLEESLANQGSCLEGFIYEDVEQVAITLGFYRNSPHLWSLGRMSLFYNYYFYYFGNHCLELKHDFVS